MSKKFKIGRIELKLQTDGYYSGNPSVFVEFFGCNLKCPNLNSGHKAEPLPTHYENLKDVHTSLIKTGCDHAHSWHQDFYYLNSAIDLDTLCSKILDALPERSWVAPSGKPIHLVFTGGEPLLQQAAIASILKRMDRVTDIEKRKPLSYVTVETNATQELEPSAVQDFKNWERNTKYIEDFKREILFANSPKLTNTGEIVPHSISCKAIYSQLANHFKSTFKFTIPADEKYAVEIQDYFTNISRCWQQEGIDPLAYDDLSFLLRKALVYICNEASNRDQVDFSELRKLSNFCIKHGYICTLRSHLFWG